MKRGSRLGDSSVRWLARQHADPYVAEARRLGYRSRSAFKLQHIDDKFGLLRPGIRVADLGCAPGGWTQVAVQRVRPPGGRVVGVDLVPVYPIAEAILLEGDANADDIAARLVDVLGGKADVVLSDMAAAAIGHASTDHLRTLALAEAALSVAEATLRDGGALVVKVLQGAGEPDLFATMRRHFARAQRFKPKSSRAESTEMYLIGREYHRSSQWSEMRPVNIGNS